MEPLLQHEISEFLGISGAKLQACYNEAKAKIKDLPEYEELIAIFAE
jgi:hypothetical protein